MKRAWNSHRATVLAVVLPVVCAFIFVALSASVSAQCAGGSDPDALGCAEVNQQSSSNQPGESPASVNIEGTSQVNSPRADSSTEASAEGSLPAGTTHTEAEVSGANRNTRAGMIALPPSPPTEFQRFIAASAGQMLPIYGANLFTVMPTGFGPLDHGPAPAEMIVGTDDELRIRIWGQVNFADNLRVSREGDVYIPKVGAIHVAGLPFAQVPAHLRAAVDRVYRNYDLSVDLGEIHTIQVYVTGFARRPGEYTVSGLSTLVDAVFESGGPDPSGSLRHILLKRAGKTVTDFDLYALLINGDKSGDTQLQPGDILYIPAVGPQVALLGSVSKPAIYELRGTESLDTLLAASGGRTAVASGARISVERISADRIGDLASRQAFELAADAQGLSATLADGDIIRIEPILSEYRDTVTLRGAVANPGHFRWHQGMRLSELIPDRDSLVKRDYWWRRTQLGLPAPEFIELSGVAPRPVESPGEQTNWNYAVIERTDPATMTSSLIPFALGKLVLERDASQDHELRPGDVVTIFSQSDIQIPIHEQTKYVTLEGEFVHPGVYSVEPGETLRTLVQRAGGFTPQAYLYASVFTRRSTQALEQQHLSELADQLDHELMRTSAGRTTGVNASTQQAEQMQMANRELVAHIRNIRASGRIVLNLRPRPDGAYDLPDMQLEDGDRYVVPFTPETVQVIGAVYNPHAFLFQAHGTGEKYLRLAGGPNRDADRKRIYVLRADGSVSGRDQDAMIFSSGIGNLRLHPGDSIVVPEKNLRISAFNQALGWAQAVSQSSLTALEAAAISTQ